MAPGICCLCEGRLSGMLVALPKRSFILSRLLESVGPFYGVEKNRCGNCQWFENGGAALVEQTAAG
jgi:hypothetical protein